jgi:hypothetical protein
MTKEEINAKTSEKVKQVTDLCKLLQITMTPEEVITQDGMIRKVIYYLDNEKYPEEVHTSTPEVQQTETPA